MTPKRVAEAAPRTLPTHSTPTSEATLLRRPWTRAPRVEFRAVTCIVVTAVSVFGVGGSGATASPGGNSITGTFLTLRSSGVVELLSSHTGSVLRTLVGPSPIDSDGRHLGDADGLTATRTTAFIAFNSPRPVIESIPLGGGRLTYVTAGMSPAVNGAGTQLAFSRPSASGGSTTDNVVVRDLLTGSEASVYSNTGYVEDLSWSADGTELAMSGDFETRAVGSSVGYDLVGVQVLALHLPISSTNPQFVGPAYSLNPLTGATTSSAALANIAASTHAPIWTDGQFLGSGHNVAAVVSRPIGSVCQATSTVVVSVDSTTGTTTTVASFPFMVPNAVFDDEGDLVAFERPPPVSCPRASPTTTSGNASSSASGSGRAVRIRWVLYKWNHHQAIRLTDDVIEVAVVP
jgi:hypothetical protein